MFLQNFIKKKFNTDEQLPFNIPVVEYNKGVNITNRGDIETNIYFIVSGIVESYMPGGNKVKQDNIIEFTFENEFVTSLSSLLKEIPSGTYTQCFTDCTVQVIPYKELVASFETSMLANKLYRYFLENYYLNRIKTAKDMLTKTADQRYLSLIKNRPNVIDSIPLGHIAKYLGIHPNSLSRIRKEIKKSNL